MSRTLRTLLDRSAPGGLGVVAFALLVATSCEGGPEPRQSRELADLVLRNGKVVTVDPSFGEAEAVAIQGDRIVFVGSDDEIAGFIGDRTEVIDLDGRLAVPGFIEGHGHFMSLGHSKTILELGNARTWAEIVSMVEAAAAEADPGEWIEGRGWHQEKWTEEPPRVVESVPVHDELSAVSPDNPVILGHASGHGSFVNARAMELAGIDRDTPDPDGGKIVRDASGEATGYLRETAQDLAEAALATSLEAMDPERRRERFETEVGLAGEEALRHGVTSFHDAGTDFATIDEFKRLADEGRLPIRLYVMVRYESLDEMDARLPEYRMIGYGNDFLTVRSIKRQIDGALGSHGAWLLEPYSDLPETSGLVLEPVEEIRATAELAMKHGYQLNTHAIGDRANQVVLDIYEEVFRANPDETDLRWRIEHAQHLDPADVSRFAELGVIASMQAVHATSDGPWVPERIGDDRARSGAYLWRSLIDAGVTVTNGTDTPVESIDPLPNFYASVTRQMGNGESFYPRQSMTRAGALRSYTINNAYASFTEDRLGSITPGKLADITVLSKDIMMISPGEIPTARVDYTILAGEVRYQGEGARKE